jgi:hypothetical protein
VHLSTPQFRLGLARCSPIDWELTILSQPDYIFVILAKATLSNRPSRMRPNVVISAPYAHAQVFEVNPFATWRLRK